MLKAFFLTLSCLCAVPLAQAGIRYDLDDAATAATVDGVPVPAVVVGMLQGIAVRQDPQAQAGKVLHAVIEDRLVADYARRNFPADQLVIDNKVGYKPDVQRDQALMADLQAAYGPAITAAVRHERGGNLDSLVTARHLPVLADWNAVFGTAPKMLLEYALDDSGRGAAAGIVLLRYRLDRNNRGAFTLLDVYDAQNVQGRQRLHDHDAAFAMEQAQLLLERRYVLHWAETHSPLGAAGYRAFVQAVTDRMVRERWMDLIGVSTDIHEHNAHLTALANAATADEVRAYYDRNRDQFRRIEKVRARHIRVADEATANALYARLRNGEDFATLARADSLADDRAQGGDLGWIVHDDRNVPWLESLAFIQQQGVPSRPFRSPGKPGSNPAWEILLTDVKVEGYQPPDSSSVRYVASQAIAREKALAEYRSTVQSLWDAADIHVSRALQPAPDKRPGVSR